MELKMDCFWPRCSDHKRCQAHGSCVAKAQAGGAAWPDHFTTKAGNLATSIEVALKLGSAHPGVSFEREDLELIVKTLRMMKPAKQAAMFSPRYKHYAAWPVVLWCRWRGHPLAGPFLGQFHSGDVSRCVNCGDRLYEATEAETPGPHSTGR